MGIIQARDILHVAQEQAAARATGDRRVRSSAKINRTKVRERPLIRITQHATRPRISRKLKSTRRGAVEADIIAQEVVAIDGTQVGALGTLNGNRAGTEGRIAADAESYRRDGITIDDSTARIIITVRQGSLAKSKIGRITRRKDIFRT